MQKILIIFGRLPDMNIPAKTGLGEEIEDEMLARKIGHDVTIQTLKKFSTMGRDCVQKIFYYGGKNFVTDEQIQIFEKQYPEYVFVPQPEGKDVLGMKDAFEEIFDQYPESKIILLGTDIIGLDAGIIEDCFDALTYFDSCIVPMEDLGYGLVGLRKNIDIFSDIKNFSSRTEGYNLVKETEELCSTKNISLFIHPTPCFDIDTKQDAIRAKIL